MKFQTISGSVYELNTDSKKIRRINGLKDPTPRQGANGEWKDYKEIDPNPIRVGSSVLILWSEKHKMLPETQSIYASAGLPVPEEAINPSTMTSIVITVEK